MMFWACGYVPRKLLDHVGNNKTFSEIVFAVVLVLSVNCILGGLVMFVGLIFEQFNDNDLVTLLAAVIPFGIVLGGLSLMAYLMGLNKDSNNTQQSV